MIYKDKTLIVTIDQPNRKGVYWFERYFKRIYQTIKTAKNVDVLPFEIMYIAPFEKVDTRIDSDGDRKIDWHWYYNHITTYAVKGGFNNICYHITEKERDRLTLAKNIGGVFENDNDDILEFYIIADKGDYSSRYRKTFAPDVTEFERIFLHEKLHGYVSKTDKKKTMYFVDGESYDITHYHDYVLNNVHKGYTLIDMGPYADKLAGVNQKSDVKALIDSILGVVATIQSKLDKRLVYPVDKELFIHNSSQRFLLPNKIYQSGVHNGYDIACPLNTKIVAPFQCEVYEVFTNHASMGNAMFVKLTTTDGFTWHIRLLHLNAVPKKGSYKKGVEIGRTGNTGMSTGPHLHIDVWRVPIDTSLIKTREGVEKYLVDPYAFFLKYVDDIDTPAIK